MQYTGPMMGKKKKHAVDVKLLHLAKKKPLCISEFYITDGSKWYGEDEMELPVMVKQEEAGVMEEKIKNSVSTSSSSCLQQVRSDTKQQQCDDHQTESESSKPCW